MISISLCMIVKNEEKVLRRCLDSIKDLVEEIIIVDTGSTDRTKEIAADYTDKIYDFEWIDDFAAARNFSFSKATCDYIYIADADEYLDEVNREEFMKVKLCMLPEIEIVQMHYNTIDFDTVLNVKNEYRPKLFKRLREFTWIDEVHETVRINPIVFDSDVVVTHAPENLHHKRDFGIFKRIIERKGMLSNKLIKMYGTELMKQGELADFSDAKSFFEDIYENEKGTENELIAACVLSKFYRESGDIKFFTDIANSGIEYTSEICLELAKFYFAEGKLEASILFANKARFETEALLDVHTSGDEAIKLTLEAYNRLYENPDEEKKKIIADLQEELINWQMPSEEQY